MRNDKNKKAATGIGITQSCPLCKDLTHSAIARGYKIAPEGKALKCPCGKGCTFTDIEVIKNGKIEKIGEKISKCGNYVQRQIVNSQIHNTTEAKYHIACTTYIDIKSVTREEEKRTKKYKEWQEKRPTYEDYKTKADFYTIYRTWRDAQPLNAAPTWNAAMFILKA